MSTSVALSLCQDGYCFIGPKNPTNPDRDTSDKECKDLGGEVIEEIDLKEDEEKEEFDCFEMDTLGKKYCCDPKCPICLMPVKPSQERYVTKCCNGQVFHKSCWDRSTKGTSTCPFCKSVTYVYYDSTDDEIDDQNNDESTDDDDNYSDTTDEGL